jgi:hypothetical protein
MIHQHNYSSLPLNVSYKIRHEGRHKRHYYYFGMGQNNTTLFSDLHGAGDKIFLDPAGGWQLFIDRLMAMTVWSFAELHRKHGNVNGPGLPRVP